MNYCAMDGLQATSIHFVHKGNHILQPYDWGAVNTTQTIKYSKSSVFYNWFFKCLFKTMGRYKKLYQIDQ